MNNMISLRDIREKDEEMIREWRNRPEVAKYMFTDHEISKEEHQRWFQHILSQDSCRYWIIVEAETDVGLACVTNLDPVHRSASWAFYIASPEFRGRGIGYMVEYYLLKYVFENLAYNRLCCEVLVTNEAALRLHKRFGFHEERLLKGHVIKAGQPTDVVTLAMSREEWTSGKLRIEEMLRQKKLMS